MKKYLWGLFLTLLLMCFTSCSNPCKNLSKDYSTPKQLTTKEKIDDFNYMYNILKENYPYFEVNKRQNKVDWLNKKNDYISMIKSTKNDKEFFNTLQNILKELNNGHTDFMPEKAYSPFVSLCLELDVPNKAWLDELNKPKSLERYSYNNDNINKKNNPNIYKNPVPNNFRTEILEKDKVAYLYIKSFDYYNIDSDKKVIYKFLQKVKDYKVLIIDIRNNGGGSDNYWQENIVSPLLNKTVVYNTYLAFRGGKFSENFIENKLNKEYDSLDNISKIKKENLSNTPPELENKFKYYQKSVHVIHPQYPIGFKGKIYLITNKKVFSASESFSVFAKSTGFATLMGEPTGGDGIGFDPAICSLPNSGYIFRFPLDLGMSSDGTCNFEHKTIPDIKCNPKMHVNIRRDDPIKIILKNIN
ncbi:S41 family peptidase [Clostridium massiliodielmoense]|uniref:S41 family peptidase n=1 Tax=Clostridium massiliodielmoense TaxID=1776385 RepID=UPI0004D5AEDF|nr:S41 family peptidase [Clostridium massiliodielmoense]KEH98499.1 peptidase S41 [Clostridium botulinum C/D str. BKT12695]